MLRAIAIAAIAVMASSAVAAATPPLPLRQGCGKRQEIIQRLAGYTKESSTALDFGIVKEKWAGAQGRVDVTVMPDGSSAPGANCHPVQLVFTGTGLRRVHPTQSPTIQFPSAALLALGRRRPDARGSRRANASPQRLSPAVLLAPTGLLSSVTCPAEPGLSGEAL